MNKLYSVIEVSTFYGILDVTLTIFLKLCSPMYVYKSIFSDSLSDVDFIFPTSIIS